MPKDKRGPEQLPARFIALIGKLYYVEAQARRDEVDLTELGRRRREHSVPVLAEIEALLLTNLHAVLPGGLLGKALHYLSSQWSKLTRFVEDARYGLDNNNTENAIRPFCVGRRNWRSPTRWPGPTRARTCIHCCRPARSTASTAIDTSGPC